MSNSKGWEFYNISKCDNTAPKAIDNIFLFLSLPTHMMISIRKGKLNDIGSKYDTIFTVKTSVCFYSFIQQEGFNLN